MLVIILLKLLFNLYKNNKSIIDIFLKIWVSSTIIFGFIAKYLKINSTQILPAVNFLFLLSFLGNLSLR